MYKCTGAGLLRLDSCGFSRTDCVTFSMLFMVLDDLERFIHILNKCASRDSRIWSHPYLVMYSRLVEMFVTCAYPKYAALPVELTRSY